MLAAYLKNPALVPADYPQGVRSVVRQELILQAMDVEQKTNREHLNTLLHTTLVPAAGTDQGRSELVHTINTAFTNYSLGLTFNMRALAQQDPESRTSKMKNIYGVLLDHKLVGPNSKNFTKEELNEIMEQMREKERLRELQESAGKEQ